MHAGWRWLFGGSLLVPVFIACSATSSGGLPPGQGDQGDDDSGTGGSGGSSGLSSGGGSGFSTFNAKQPDAHPPAQMFTDSACKAGFYQGSFTGMYSSHLTLFGINIPVSGNVELTLDQEGSSTQTCSIMVEGEGMTTESCSDLFTLSGGTITGVADGNDSGGGGFPYYCSMTGTLDCAKKVLDNGWIECTYCLGSITDGGDPLATCNLAGGNFAGPLTANYDTSTLAFTDGTWNGAEVLCSGIAGTSNASCNDGGSPGPEGGSPYSYLVADGGYGLAPHFGGAGNWSAPCLDCGDH
jgi:hypothetical protein